MVKGIGLGIGFVIGLVIALLAVALIVAAIMLIYNLYLRRKFNVELFIEYRKKLLNRQCFEELSAVDEIISSLMKNEQPKELLKKYSIKVYSYFAWKQMYDGGERLTFRHDRKIIKRKSRSKRNSNNQKCN